MVRARAVGCMARGVETNNLSPTERATNGGLAEADSVARSLTSFIHDGIEDTQQVKIKPI